MLHLFDSLIQSETRSKLLRLLLIEQRVGSVSELARRASLSPRAIGVEVDHLLQLGLVQVEALGATRRVSANWSNPACTPLVNLLNLPSTRVAPDNASLRASLAHHGAPLMGTEPIDVMLLEATVLASLASARNNGTILRILPIVIAKNRHRINWVDLKEGARRACLKAELGWLLEFTGMLLSDDKLLKHASELKDRRRTRKVYYPEARNRFEQELAEDASPEVARRWGFMMNMSEASARSLLAKHCPDVSLA
jgi:hypothetical protein